MATTTAAKLVPLEGPFPLYLPQDDAVAAGLGGREGGIDVSEAQEVVDILNQKLAALLRLDLRQFWKQVAVNESLHNFVDSYLQFRRRWYNSRSWANSGAPTAGVVVGDGDLSRRVFMLLYRMSANKDPVAPTAERLSPKEHAALLKEKKCLDLPKLLDTCAVYVHDNPDLTHHLVSNTFRAQPSYSDDLQAMVLPMLQTINTMHLRCCTAIDSLQESAIEAVKEQLTEVVEYLNDVIITLDAFVRAYPPAAAILISAGVSSNSIGMFLSAIAAIHNNFLPVLSTGFIILASPPLSSSDGKTNIEVTSQHQLKQLKMRLVNFAWKLLSTCYLGDKDVGIPTDNPSLGANYGGSTLMEDPGMKGGLLVQAVVSLSMELTESDRDGVLGSLSSVSQSSSMGGLLQSLDKHHGLCEKIHELCNSGAILLDDAQYDYVLALVAVKKPKELGHISHDVSKPLKLSVANQKEDNEDVIMLQSKISQVKDLFPDYGDGFITLCLEAYDNDPEKVIQQILDGRLHPDLASLDTSLAAIPSSTSTAKDNKGKGKLTEEPAGNASSRLSSTLSSGSAAGNASVGSSSGQPSSGLQPALREAVNAQNGNSKQGRFVRRGKEQGNMNELLNRREAEAFSATVRAGKQYEYEDEYDDSFDDLSGIYIADVGEEESENLVDRVRRKSMPSGGVADESSERPRRGGAGLLEAVSVIGRDQNFDQRYSRQQGSSRGGRTGVVPSPPSVNSPLSGHPGRGGNFRGQQGGKLPDSHQHPHVPVESSIGRSRNNSAGSVTTSNRGQAGDSSVLSEPLDPGTNPVAQEPPRTAHGGRSRIGKGKIKPTANFYLKDGKLYSYKVAGAEAGFESVEEYEASKRDEEELLYGLGAGGNVPAALGEEKDGLGNSGGGPAIGASGRGRGGSLGRGRYVQKNHDNHRRKDQAMRKHFAGLGGT